MALHSSVTSALASPFAKSSCACSNVHAAAAGSIATKQRPKAAETQNFRGIKGSEGSKNSVLHDGPTKRL
jgi:hypothetical protein